MRPDDLHVLLTRTGTGTPCGELMRRYWQPAALTEELPPGGPPVPVRLFGEDLVLYRDEQGRPGLLGLHCAHRGADLSYGRLEDGGLRCLYHGWLYDVTGRCLEQPGEPDGSTFCERGRQPAYPCVERGGVVFAYLGPGEPPVFPNYEWLHVPEGQYVLTKVWQECNYLQANEGNIDLSHLSFLHVLGVRYFGGNVPPGAVLPSRGEAPGVESAEVELTPYGMRSAKIRRDLGADAYHLYTTELVLPNITAFWVGPNYDTTSRNGYSVHWHVPIDDENHWKYVFRFSRHRPLDPAEPIYRLETENYRGVYNRTNRYGQDRAAMKSTSYTGLRPDFHLHDQWATEGQGPIYDFTQEHLGALDVPMVVHRKLLLKAIEDVQAGRDPAGVVRDPARNRFPIVTVEMPVSADRNWKDVCRELEADVTLGLPEAQVVR
jgi:phthalate 4,5-dioxygenase oxygenase subunit